MTYMLHECVLNYSFFTRCFIVSAPTHPNGVIQSPLLGQHSVTNALKEVDQQLALEAVVHHDCSVGHVQHNEAKYGDDHQHPTERQVGAEEKR